MSTINTEDDPDAKLLQTRLYRLWLSISIGAFALIISLIFWLPFRYFSCSDANTYRSLCGWSFLLPALIYLVIFTLFGTQSYHLHRHGRARRLRREANGETSQQFASAPGRRQISAIHEAYLVLPKKHQRGIRHSVVITVLGISTALAVLVLRYNEYPETINGGLLIGGAILVLAAYWVLLRMADTDLGDADTVVQKTDG